MFIKLVRLGRDAELRYTNTNKPVLSLACVYDIGWGDNKKSQWIDGSVWGDKAEKLQQYLTKGKKVLIQADDIELETYQKNDGTSGSKLKCRVLNVEFADSQQSTTQQQTPQQSAPQSNSQGFKSNGQQFGQQQPQQPQQQGGFQQQAPQQPYQPQTARQQTNSAVQQNVNQQAPKVNPQEPTIDFDDGIPF